LATIHVEVAGRVQGVGFRWFVREVALRAGVSGWIRNRPDGNVEIAASGSEHAIAQLLDAARTGPPGARIDRVADLPAVDQDDLPRPFTVVR
jgi:acylphosphatase